VLVWPIMMATIGPRFALGAFMRAFRHALRIHGYEVDQVLLRRSEKAAQAMQDKLIRQSKAARDRRGSKVTEHRLTPGRCPCGGGLSM
jgi:hypothetical protein